MGVPTVIETLEGARRYASGARTAGFHALPVLRTHRNTVAPPPQPATGQKFLPFVKPPCGVARLEGGRTANKTKLAS